MSTAPLGLFSVRAKRPRWSKTPLSTKLSRTPSPAFGHAMNDVLIAPPLPICTATCPSRALAPLPNVIFPP